MSNELQDLIQIAAEEVYAEIDFSVFDEPEPSSERWFINFPSKFVVVGHDGEYADMDNPTGAIICERFYILAEDAKGNRRIWGDLYDSPEAAEAAYAFLAPAVSNWEATRPCYGSEAWTPEVDAAEVEAELAADDFDMFEPELQM